MDEREKCMCSFTARECGDKWKKVRGVKTFSTALW